MTENGKTDPAAPDELAVVRWLQQRLEEGDLEPADLAQLAARYALAEREPLLQELRERIQEWNTEHEPGLDGLRGAFADALSRGAEYGFAITRANVVEVVREELALAGFHSQSLDPSMDSSILSMFEELGDAQEPGEANLAQERPRRG